MPGPEPYSTQSNKMGARQPPKMAPLLYHRGRKAERGSIAELLASLVSFVRPDNANCKVQSTTR
eukprot:scaffold4063_cov169-Skeletonema_menzelii.AAC.3